MKNSLRLPSVGAILFALVSLVMLTPVIGQAPADIFAGVAIVSSCLPITPGVLGLNNMNNMSARDSYRIAIDLFVKAFKNKFGNNEAATREWVNGRKLSQSEIRLETTLNATSNTYTFGLTANQQSSAGVIFNTENRLTMQDSLVCSEYGIFVGKPASATDTVWLLRTYGNTQDFTAAAALDLDSTFYSHGYFRITANNDVIMPYRGLFNHWYKPQTQQTAALGAASPGDQIRGSEDGFVTMEPNILLIGSKGYLPQIVLPVNLATADANSRVVLIFRGILAQNSTSVS